METRPLRALALSCCLSVALSPLTVAQGTTDPGDSLSPAEWRSLGAAVQAARHELREVEGGWFGTNPGQALRLHLDERGCTVRSPRAEWTWGLELEAFGYAGSMQETCASGSFSSWRVDGSRGSRSLVEGLEEWWVNDPAGVEHGFTIRKRPEPVVENAPLALVLSMHGDWTVSVSADARSATFHQEECGSRLYYSGLSVLDADGRSLDARLEVDDEGLRILIDEADAHYPLTIDPLVQQGYLKASNPDVQDQFGESIDVSGDTVVVGVRLEDSNATGVDGNQLNNSASQSGAAYVFLKVGAGWVQQAYLKASNTGSSDNFGVSVGISDDTIVVGALFEDSNASGVDGDQSNNSLSGAGAAYVFERNTLDVWSQQAYLKASAPGNDDRFGISVAIDEDTIVVGAIFEDSSATGVNGDDTDNGTANSGAAYVFTRLGTTWTQQAYLKSSNPDTLDRYGADVAVDGDTIVVGVSTEASAAVGVDGDASDNSAMSAGAAFVYFRTGTTWAQQAYLKASNTNANDGFGRNVAVSGNLVVVGARNEQGSSPGAGGDQSDNSLNGAGAVYVFERNAGVWSQVSYLKSPDPGFGDGFGADVDIEGDLIVIGADGESSGATGVDGDFLDNSVPFAGAAFVYGPCGSDWAFMHYLKPPQPDTLDAFGRNVGISGGTIVTTALRESSDAVGVDGDPLNNDLSESGAAFVFDLSTPFPPYCEYPSLCNGDGGDLAGCTDCPCGNNATEGTVGGCLNSVGTSARLIASGDASISLPSGATTDLRFAMTGATLSSFCILSSGSAVAPVNPAQPCFGLDSGVTSVAFDGLRCASLGVLRHGNRSTDASGGVGFTNPPWGGEGNPVAGIAAASSFAAGQVRYFQCIYRDDELLNCMTGLNTSQAIEVNFQP